VRCDRWRSQGLRQGRCGDEGDQNADLGARRALQGNGALQLYTIVFESDGVAPPPTVLISEALTGYLADGGRPRHPLVTALAKAQAVLHQGMGAGNDDEPGSARTRLTPSAVAAMVGWALSAGEHAVSASAEARVDGTGTGTL
jgi:hypothetical protein